MKALVIINAHAGKGDHDAVRETIARRLREGDIDFEFEEIKKGDYAADVVRRRLHDGFDLVVAAGGDGTVSCTLDGMQGSDIPIGIIPAGTGNMIARELDIPTKIDDAAALIAGRDAQHKRIDAMRIGDHIYALNAGVGINAAVVANTSRKDKSRLGFLAYVITTLRLLRSRPRRVDITVDGETRQYRTVEVAISNCGILARTLYPSGPEIRADDGRLDIWILSLESFFDYVRYLVGDIILRRRTRATFLAARNRIVIDSERPWVAQADGEVIGHTPLEIELVPGAVTVLVPATTLPAQGTNNVLSSRA
jgi:diacylglycerol kinase (ATP)